MDDRANHRLVHAVLLRGTGDLAAVGAGVELDPAEVNAGLAAAGVAGLDVAVGNGAQRGGLALGRPAAVVAHSVLDVGIDLAADPARAGAAAGAGDRKSTRLNSSH